MVLQCPRGGERLAYKSPTYPHLAPTGDHSPNREHYATCLHLYVLLKNTNLSNVPPLGQQTAGKSPHGDLPAVETPSRVGGGGA